ncbi:MAG: hypothetical protein WCS88_03345 [Patescibacteria group bacterium]|jgi:hypothetical protein
MSQQIIQLAQVGDPILNNLANTENKLLELNQELGSIVVDYQNINTASPSFFNFDNPFFLLTLVGLFMLLFALWFLKKELKYEQNKNKLSIIRKKELELKEKLAKEEEEKKIKLKKVQAIELEKASKIKGRKIKVIKVK